MRVNSQCSQPSVSNGDTQRNLYTQGPFLEFLGTHSENACAVRDSWRARAVTVAQPGPLVVVST